ncbi:MAG: hypothetical protein WCP11_01080 [Candidatus Saccharibacteria bacterium]
MFKKIVSNLSFSPALIGQLGFYAKRLRKEEITRKLGLFFVILTLIIQSLVIFQPAESANASNQSDMVNGGIGNYLDNFLNPYDANTKHIKDVMDYAGITRAEIVTAKLTTFKVNKKISWGFVSKFSYAQGERQHNITDTGGKRLTTVYSRPLALWNGADVSVKAWVGHSEKIGWFAIMQACGNLVTDTLPVIKKEQKCTFNNSLLATDPRCISCDGNETIWAYDTTCAPNIIKTKTASNITKGFVDASSVTAEASDKVSYTINIENKGLKSTTVSLEDNLSDVLEYAKLTDNGGGALSSVNILKWPGITLAPNSKQSRTFIVKLLDEIPATAKGASEGTSYDCIMTNTFGNSTNINVQCPTVKVIEQVVKKLPVTGPGENIVFIGIVLAVATYFYARSRQMKAEIHLIKQDAIAGTI